MNPNHPILDPKACPRCHRKPCHSLAQAGCTSVALVGIGEIPFSCPLIIHLSSLDRYESDLTGFTLSQALAPLRGFGGNSLPTIIPSGTPPAALIRSLHSQGKICIIAAPFGSPARRQLDAWKGAKIAAFRKAEKARVEEEAAELEKEKPKPTFIEASWVWLADTKKPGCEERVLSFGVIQEAIWCKIDTEGLMPGDSVTFNLFLKGRDGKADIKITTEAGRVGEKRKDDAAVTRWVIPDQIQGYKLQPKIDQIYFIARCSAHGLEMKSPDLKLTPVWKIWLQIDVDHPKAKDDELILTDESGAEVQRVKVSAMKEIDQDYVELSFPDLDMTKKYTLMRDYGPDEDGGKEFLFEDLTPEFIDTLANET
jgi:hypothetical protein